MKSLVESLLDDEDVLLSNTDNGIIKEWLDKYATGKYKIIYLKDGTLKLSSGNLIIENFDGEYLLPILKFSSVKGNIFIENCNNLKNIDNLFDRYVKYDGNLSITLCPKLESLNGLPLYIHGDLNIISNKSLRSLEGVSNIIVNNLCFIKNGKKRDKKYINNYITALGTINCSYINDDDLLTEGLNEAYLLTEELNEPHLLKLAKQLIDDKSGSFSNIFRNERIKWNKVTLKDVEEYNLFDNPTEAKKLLRKLISKKYHGVILLMANNKYTYIITPYQYWTLGKHTYDKDVVYSEVMELVDQSDVLVYINLSGIEQTYDLMSYREKSREGMILPGDKEHYKSIAKANIKRYKEIIAKNKLNKSKTYVKLDEAIQNVLQRVMKAVMKVHSDPVKFADKEYELTYMQTLVYDQQYFLGMDKKSHNLQYHGEEGLLYLYKEYNKWYMILQTNPPKHGGPEYAENALKQYEKKCYNVINRINMYLTDFGV